MLDQIPEADWKIFRRLRGLALERFCERVLAEIDGLRTDSLQSSHERYIQIYRLLERRDQELAQAFNNPRRSVAIMQLAAFCQHRLVNEDEFLRFSELTRQTIERILRR